MEIISIEPQSLAEELELVTGDKIIEVNGKKPLDIIELSFLLADEEIEMLIEHSDGEREIIAFEKDIDEELGASFDTAVCDGIRRCKNRCVFCFVDMIAPNMRQTLSVKDDDYRLSFLYGNFITLSNLTDRDFKRIKKFHLSPLYISIHAMNPKVREILMRTKLATKISEQLDKLEAAGVEYHTQIVLCPNINDGAELDYTISELIKRRPNALSLAIVPVGITKYRRDKFPLTQFDKFGAAKVIEQVEHFQKKMRSAFGETFIYLGDEFYFLAEREMPPAEYYDDFPQIENGIGMTRNFIDEFHEEKNLATTPLNKKISVDIIAGTSIAVVLKKLAAEVNIDAKVIPVVNEFFGSRINVSGLLTGNDIINALKKSDRPRDKILIPATALRSGEETFLDDVTVDDMREIFKTEIVPIHNGAEFFRILTGEIKI